VDLFKEVGEMKKVFVFVSLVMALAIMLSPATSHSKSLTMPNGDVYESACGRIKVRIDIYSWVSDSKKMVYAGRVVDLVELSGKTIVWIQKPKSLRAEPKLLKTVCNWAWVKVKEAKK
jgi:hypothetical protein